MIWSNKTLRPAGTSFRLKTSFSSRITQNARVSMTSADSWMLKERWLRKLLLAIRSSPRRSSAARLPWPRYYRFWSRFTLYGACPSNGPWTSCWKLRCWRASLPASRYRTLSVYRRVRRFLDRLNTTIHDLVRKAGNPPASLCQRKGAVLLSHVVTIQTEVRDPTAILAACQRLGLPPPVRKSVQLFSGTAEGLAVELPGWHYPLVCDLANG